MNAERWADSLEVCSIREEPLRVAEFPGYPRTLIDRAELDLIVAQGIPSWRSALSAVAGVYVIADKTTGELYVGSATGEGGIWSRWCSYAQTGHGGNVELSQLLEEKGSDYANNFQFGVLEIVDTNASTEEVLAREKRWKDLLLTREFGYNAN